MTAFVYIVNWQLIGRRGRAIKSIASGIRALPAGRLLASLEESRVSRQRRHSGTGVRYRPTCQAPGPTPSSLLAYFAQRNSLLARIRPILETSPPGSTKGQRVAFVDLAVDSPRPLAVWLGDRIDLYNGKEAITRQSKIRPGPDFASGVTPPPDAPDLFMFSGRSRPPNRARDPCKGSPAAGAARPAHGVSDEPRPHRLATALFPEC